MVKGYAILTPAPWDFLRGFPAMLFSSLASYVPLTLSAARHALFMLHPMSYHYYILVAFLRRSMALQVQSILRLFPGHLSGFLCGGIWDIGGSLKRRSGACMALQMALYPVGMVYRGIILPCLASCDDCAWFTINYAHSQSA